MSKSCTRCGAILSLPTTHCQNCGEPIPTLEPLGDGHDTVDPQTHFGAGDGSDIQSVFALGPTPGHAPQDVDLLLRQIADQSHFEERYELLGVLATGGMGQVTRAIDRILKREVAIKMMRESQGSSGPAIRGQFLKEARVGGRLLHPNVLPVFDLGVNRNKQIYYTMRLVEGASLQSCLESIGQGVTTKLISFPLAKVVRVFQGVCEGVDYAHQNGVIHLDLKPQNILVSGFSEVFVIDWGLARVDDVDDTEALLDLYRNARTLPADTASHTVAVSPDFTGTQAAPDGKLVVGTPSYMAPEQALGVLKDYNITTDVFGLGGILYFILYGTHPNRGATVQQMLASAQGAPQPGTLRDGILPSRRRVSSAARNAVDSLAAICLKALQPRQADRYQEVHELIVDLNEWLEDAPAALPPV